MGLLNTNTLTPANVPAATNIAPTPATVTPPAVGTPISVAQSTPATQNTATTYNPTTGTAPQYTLNPATDTTSGQLNSVIDQNSPLMQRAKALGMQTANDRGMLNSSIAAGEAQNAVLAAATPIAQSNAAANLQTGLTNVQNANTMAQTNVQQQNQAAAAGAQAVNTASLQNVQNTQQTNLANASEINKINSLAVDENTKLMLQNIVSGNAQLIQGNAELGQMYNSTMQNIQAITMSTTMDAAAKQAAVNNQITLLNQGLAASQSVSKTSPLNLQALNIGQYFQPQTDNTTPATNQPIANTAANPSLLRTA